MDITEIEKHKELIASKVHDAWHEEKKAQGFHSPMDCPFSIKGKFEKGCAKCHTDMYPYDELPENIKEYDRVTVTAVLHAISKI